MSELRVDAEAVKAAITTTIARQILEALDSGHRDAILTESIEKALTQYDFHRAVQDVVAQRAQEIARDMVQSEEWTAKIREAALRSFDAYLTKIVAVYPQR
jgi:dTDP-4-dehydrorhamnose reductase